MEILGKMLKKRLETLLGNHKILLKIIELNLSLYISLLICIQHNILMLAHSLSLFTISSFFIYCKIIQQTKKNMISTHTLNISAAVMFNKYNIPTCI